MLIHARDVRSGDIIMTPSWNTEGVAVKSVSLNEDGSIKLGYENGSIEWFDSHGIVVRKDTNDVV